MPKTGILALVRTSQRVRSPTWRIRYFQSKEGEELQDPMEKNQMDQWKTSMFLYDSALKEISTKIGILNNEFIHVCGHTPI